MTLNFPFRRLAALTLLAASVVVGGCDNGSGSDDGGTTGGDTSGGTTGGSTGSSTGGTTGGATTGGTSGGLTGGGTGGGSGEQLYVSFDRGGDAGSTDIYLSDLSAKLSSFDTGLNEGIVDIGGTLNALGVIGGTAVLRQFDDFANRGDGAFDDTRDEQFSFAELRAPKGLSFAGLTRNQLIVADAPAPVTGEDLALVPSVHALSTVLGLVDPRLLTTVPVSVAGGRTWDVAYDPLSDRLFAAMTNGTIAVYDTFIIRANLASLGGPEVSPSRTITPGAVVDGSSTKLSVNLHGIEYDRGSDTLVVSDVGLATDEDDGAIFVIANARDASDTATGGGPAIVAPARVLLGAATLLGNPVDVLLRGDGRLFVAEKLNGGGQILVFNDILTGTTSGNIAPDQAVATASLGSSGTPEALAEPN
jgi:hypothetical protein